MSLPRFVFGVILAGMIALPGFAQAAPSAYSDSVPDQVTAFYVRTITDYSFNTGTQIERTSLSGGGAEYAYRRFYPFELLGTFRYSYGHVLSQHLFIAAAGVGYSRYVAGVLDGRIQHGGGEWYERWSPFISMQVGLARTSSSQSMYLYTKPMTGFASLLSAGVDYQLRRHIAIRPIFLEDEYLPFGVQGQHSTYWQFGAGVGYTFHWR